MRSDADTSRVVKYEVVKNELDNISLTFYDRKVCKMIIGTVKVATEYCDNVDGLWCDISSVITHYIYSKISQEYLSSK